MAHHLSTTKRGISCPRSLCRNENQISQVAASKPRHVSHPHLSPQHLTTLHGIHQGCTTLAQATPRPMDTCNIHRINGVICCLSKWSSKPRARPFVRAGAIVILLEPMTVCGRNTKSCHLPLCFGWQSAQASEKSSGRNQAVKSAIKHSNEATRLSTLAPCHRRTDDPPICSMP